MITALPLDAFGLMLEGIGLPMFRVAAAVCHSWQGRVRAKVLEWGSLEHVRQFGKFGSSAGCFDTPTRLCFLPEYASLCVVDSCNSRLQVLSVVDGEVRRVIGRPGASPGQFTSPSGIACDGVSLFVLSSDARRGNSHRHHVVCSTCICHQSTSKPSSLWRLDQPPATSHQLPTNSHQPPVTTSLQPTANSQQPPAANE